MKKTVLAMLAFASFAMNAQDLPAPSPFSTLEQRVGLTDFTVEYSRPGVKGREVFGDLVPDGKVWRTGANKATAIEFNTPVTFAGQLVPAGKYSLFTIPNQDTWTVILNKNTELWGADGYDEKQDVLRADVAALTTQESTETLTIDFQSIDGGKAELVIRWANKVLSLPIEVDVQAKAIANIKAALANSNEDDLWKVNRNAAIYYTRNNIDQKAALEYIEKSLKLKADNWYAHYVHGEILYALGENKKAVKAAEKAMEVGTEEANQASKEFAYGAMLEEAMEKWSSK
ncbi:DUF2911 domain-containing protein [Croceimicrobium hydrocarbonivorans]|uniref:DUF2911 domain-containing protein n=1 Tax=Croceimicrobium hydrocarbonivorans TaxID=2761580 RepID=A0A7H0VEI8_9FLAO|nr:DUF2911 domain-containing protein [Croceimicrobium hydrocarbonivorans]QNR24136.1 DUF2911 domain-containing protein [Croceimicrobium hydrocarbonivorans]